MACTTDRFRQVIGIVEKNIKRSVLFLAFFERLRFVCHYSSIISGTVDFVSRLTMLDDSNDPTSLLNRDTTTISTVVSKDDLSLSSRLHRDVSAMCFSQTFWSFFCIE